jgi:hypothetical protein
MCPGTEHVMENIEPKLEECNRQCNLLTVDR